MKLFKSKVIHNCDGGVYLTRWYLIRTPWFALFLHKFHRSDEDRALHDHPWPFIVIPIWRGYIEHSQKYVGPWSDGNKKLWRLWENRTRRVYPILGIRCRPATYRHRVELIEGKPSWSLFMRFREVREWGFWPGGDFVNNKQWWNDNCE